ncbi:MAG: tetratricopeptide repeat protein [Thermoplasmata archaeon]
MPCLKCGGQTEERALLCDGCAESLIREPRFFLNPVLIGPSIYSRLRECGSAAYRLGPSVGSEVALVPSTRLEKAVQDLNVQVVTKEQLKAFYQKCDALLAHLGVPLRTDSPEMLLTEDASEIVTSIVLKVNAAEKVFPLEGSSDLYIRLGVIYWGASRGVLLKTASERWSAEKRAYLLARAKEYLSKVPPEDDLFSIAARTLGFVCLEAEEWKEAEEHLSDALRHFPNDATIGEGIARAHLMLGNHVEALSRVDEVISLGETPSLWVLKGQILREVGRHDEAIECFNRALALEPGYLPGHDELIMALRDVGRIEDAAAAEARRSLAMRPDMERRISEFLAELKGPSAEEQPRPPSPPRELGRPAKEARPEPPSPVADAVAALRAKEYDTAIQRASHILKESPGLRAAELVLIEALLAKGDAKGAEPHVHSFYERNREDPAAWYWRGVLAEKQGRWGAAIQYFSKSVSLDPRNVDAWVAMGDVLLSKGKLPGADEAYSKALQVDEENAQAWLGKAKVMRLMGRWGAAIQCLDKYNSLIPQDKSSWLMKADTLLEKGKYGRAIEAYDRYLALAPDDSYALTKKGLALNSIGRSEDARKCFDEAARLDPGNKEAAHWLRTLSEGGEA